MNKTRKANLKRKHPVGEDSFFKPIKLIKVSHDSIKLSKSTNKIIGKGEDEGKTLLLEQSPTINDSKQEGINCYENVLLKLDTLLCLSLSDIKESHRILKVTGDGNCYYRAISLYLNKEENSHIKIRNEIADFSLNNLQLFEEFLLDKGKLIRLFEDQKILGKWAEIEIIKATSELYNRIILIWTDLTESTTVFIPEKFNKQSTISIICLMLENNHFDLIDIKSQLDYSDLKKKEYKADFLSLQKSNISMTYMPRSKIKEFEYEDILMYLKTEKTKCPRYPTKIEDESLWKQGVKRKKLNLKEILIKSTSFLLHPGILYQLVNFLVLQRKERDRFLT